MELSAFFRRHKLSYNKLSSILQKCTLLKDINLAQKIHGILITSGVDVSTMSLDAKLLGVYASCSNVRYAHQLFDKMPRPNIFAFNWMISAMAFHGNNRKAIGYFYLMQKMGTLPSKYTLSVVLKTCVGLLRLDMGKEVHGVINTMGFEGEVLVCNSLIDMYCKCGKMEYARRVFDRMSVRDVATWTCMISGCCNDGRLKEALVLFERMKVDGVEPNEFTRNALIAGYAQNGDCNGALELFSRMSGEGLCTDLVTWNALISGLGRGNHPFEALNLFREMLTAGIRPNHVTVTGLLPVCGLTGSSKRGRELHGLIYRLALQVNVYVASALVDMYSKCGDVRAARNVFNTTHVRNVALWNVIIGCLGKHGAVSESLQLFEEMQEQGFRPNEVTLVCVLSTCSHSGLVDKGMDIFSSMKEKYQVEAKKEHYACVVDLLCRAGKLENAYELVKGLPIGATESILGALFNGCRIHGRRDLAAQMMEDLRETDLQNPGAFLTLSNVFAADEDWQQVENVRNLMKGKRVKQPGFSSVEIKD